MRGDPTFPLTHRPSVTCGVAKTPRPPGKGGDAAEPRTPCWARLRDRTASRTLLVVNTHVDHVGQVARVESAKLIRRWIGDHRQPGDAVVLMGDLNSPTDSPPYAAIVADTPGLIALHDTQR